MEGIVLWYSFSKTNNIPPKPHPDGFHNENFIGGKLEKLMSFGKKRRNTSFMAQEIPAVGMLDGRVTHLWH